MGFRLREIGAESKFSQALTVDLLGQIVPIATVHEVLGQVGIQT
jgi:hypothetical protein